LRLKKDASTELKEGLIEMTEVQDGIPEPSASIHKSIARMPSLE
jgi:hypothetical protein